MLDVREIHPMSDFLTNHKSHIERLKETRTPEVLTIDGHAEVVLLDTESYQDLVDRLQYMEAVASVGAGIVQEEESVLPGEEVTEEEIQRSQNVVREIMAETERLGLYR